MKNALRMFCVIMVAFHLAMESQAHAGDADFEGQYTGTSIKSMADGTIETDQIRLEVTAHGKVFGVIEVDPSKPFLQIRGQIDPRGFGYIKQGTLDPATLEVIQDPGSEKIPILVKGAKRVTGGSVDRSGNIFAFRANFVPIVVLPTGAAE